MVVQSGPGSSAVELGARGAALRGSCQIALRPGVDPAAAIPRLSKAAGAAAGMDTVPLALLIANLLAGAPGQRAARLHIGQVLRAE